MIGAAQSRIQIMLMFQCSDVLMRPHFTPSSLGSPSPPLVTGHGLELETKAIRRFAKVSIVSNSPSLMIIALAFQFHVYLPWGQSLFSIVS